MLILNNKLEIRNEIKEIFKKTIDNYRAELYFEKKFELFEIIKPIELLVIVNEIEKIFQHSFMDEELVYENFESLESIVSMIEKWWKHLFLKDDNLKT